MSITPWEVEEKNDEEGRPWAFSWTYCQTPERKATFAEIVNARFDPQVPVTAEMVQHVDEPIGEGNFALYTIAPLFDPAALTPAIAVTHHSSRLVSLLTKLAGVFGRRSLATP